jgi:hypothetical protein
VLRWGVLPQLAPQFLSFTLYRFETNIRAASILGFVGAGGIGQELIDRLEPHGVEILAVTRSGRDGTLPASRLGEIWGEADHFVICAPATEGTRHLVGAEQLAAIVQVFKQNPGMKLLTGNKDWPVTNWDPATAQKATSALLAKYPKIDGIISNYGTDALASVRAFQAANRKLVPITTLDANGLSCIYKDKGVPLSTISSRNWLGRVAARKAIAAAEGIQNTEPDKYQLPFFEDTLGGKPLVCDKSAPADFYPSNKISQADIAQYGKP